jgi:hypothetical protein
LSDGSEAPQGSAQTVHEAQAKRLLSLSPSESTTPVKLQSFLTVNCWPPGSDTDIVASKGRSVALAILQARESPPGPSAQDSDVLKDLDATGQLFV